MHTGQEEKSPKVFERRENWQAEDEIRRLRREKDSLNPKDIIDVCKEKRSVLGVVSIKCDGSERAILRHKLQDALRSTDLVYENGNVIQVFASLSKREGVSKLCDKVQSALESGSKKHIYVTCMDDPSDIFSYESFDSGTDIMELVLGKKRVQNEQVYVSSDKALTKDEMNDYIRTVHSLHPGLLGDGVKVLFAKSQGFDYLRAIRDDKADGWSVVKGRIYNETQKTENISHMLEGNDFVIYSLKEDTRYSFDDATNDLKTEKSHTEKSYR